MEEKLKFDFTTKHTKKTIAEFLAENGHNGNPTYRDKPDWLLKYPLPYLRKLAKIYNANIFFGGGGNFSEWYNDTSLGFYKTRDKIFSEWVGKQNIHPKIQNMSNLTEFRRLYSDHIWNPKEKESNEVIKEKYQKYSKFKKEEEALLSKITETSSTHSKSIIGEFIGTQEDLDSYLKLVEPFVIDWLSWIKEQEDFIKFIDGDKQEK